jgi:hypothetical protein
MEESLNTGEILARAVAYPYEAPLSSFIQRDGQPHRLVPEDLNLSDRRPLLAYGSNASPAILAGKLASHPHQELPMLRGELAGFDVVYSAHISPYGAVPSTLQRSPGTTVPVFVAYPTVEQEELLTATEPNYELHRLHDLDLNTELGPIESVDAYISRHGCLTLDGSEVALAAIEAAGRHIRSLGEVEVLERVRHVLAPELDLERFVASSLDPGLATARTAVLHGASRPLS